jgi:peptidyl-prolyl cis-trans isomerase SurA
MPNYTKLFTACFLLLGFGLNAHTQTQRAVADKIVAIIGDHTILQSDIDNTIEDMRRQGEKIPADAKCLLMRQAIASKILMQQALKDSLPVTDEDVEAELRQRLNSFAASGYSEKEISLENIPESTRPYLKERMLADAMQNKILQNVRITPSEVKAFTIRSPGKIFLPLKHNMSFARLWYIQSRQRKPSSI